MREILVLFFVVLSSVILEPCQSREPSYVEPETSDPIVTSAFGSVRGVTKKVLGVDIDAFLGIPFAKPPIDELRFAKPVPVEPWEGILEAQVKTFGCPQANQFISSHIQLLYANHTDEDCLTLNIWRPKIVDTSVRKPVLVFIYGGAFQWGSADIFMYDGAANAALNDHIFVSFNYRVGVFGFLSHPDVPSLSGSIGFWDQNLALRWVKDNIEYFGGNPDEITVSGHSAGAISAAIHAISPHARGLFRRVILQSGTTLTIGTLSRFPRDTLSKIAAQLGCEGDPEALVDCLRAFSASELINAVGALAVQGLILPPYDSDYVSLSPQYLENATFNVDEIIIGTTEHEARHFAERVVDSNENLRTLLTELGGLAPFAAMLKSVFKISISEARSIVSEYFSSDKESTEAEILDLASQAATDLFFLCPAEFFSDVAASKNVAVFRYLFRHRPTFTLFDEIPGVLHGDELLFTVGNLPVVKDLLRNDVLAQADGYVRNLTYSREEDILFESIQSAWGGFVRSGLPTLPDKRAWPRFTTSRKMYVEIKGGMEVRRTIPNTRRCALWENLIMQRQTDRNSQISDLSEEVQRAAAIEEDQWASFRFEEGRDAEKGRNISPLDVLISFF